QYGVHRSLGHACECPASPHPAIDTWWGRRSVKVHEDRSVENGSKDLDRAGCHRVDTGRSYHPMPWSPSRTTNHPLQVRGVELFPLRSALRPHAPLSVPTGGTALPL